MRTADRSWLVGGAVVLLAGGAFATLRLSANDDAPPAARRASGGSADRSLTAERVNANLAGAPSVVRVARDGAVWTILRGGDRTSLARLGRGLLHEVPLGGSEPTELVEGYRHNNAYLAYTTGASVGFLRHDGSVRAFTQVPGRAHDIALDRFGDLWFTDRARAQIGTWNGKRIRTQSVDRTPRPRLDDIVLAGGGSSKLWFLDDSGRIGLADPIGQGLRTFPAPGGRPTPGPSRLTGSVARLIWYTTRTGVGRLSEEGDGEVLVRRLPDPPGAITRGPDGNLWVAARRGPRLFRISRSGTVDAFTLDVPANARFRDLTRDPRNGALWVAAARPRALLRVPLPELRPMLP